MKITYNNVFLEGDEGPVGTVILNSKGFIYYPSSPEGTKVKIPFTSITHANLSPPSSRNNILGLTNKHNKTYNFVIQDRTTLQCLYRDIFRRIEDDEDEEASIGNLMPDHPIGAHESFTSNDLQQSFTGFGDLDHHSSDPNPYVDQAHHNRSTFTATRESQRGLSVGDQVPRSGNGSKLQGVQWNPSSQPQAGTTHHPVRVGHGQANKRKIPRFANPAPCKPVQIPYASRDGPVKWAWYPCFSWLRCAFILLINMTLVGLIFIIVGLLSPKEEPSYYGYSDESGLQRKLFCGFGFLFFFLSCPMLCLLYNWMWNANKQQAIKVARGKSIEAEQLWADVDEMFYYQAKDVYFETKYGGKTLKVLRDGSIEIHGSHNAFGENEVTDLIHRSTKGFGGGGGHGLGSTVDLSIDAL